MSLLVGAVLLLAGIVALIALALLGILLDAPFKPITRWHTRRKLLKTIERKKVLGYDTTELEEEARHPQKTPDRFARRAIKRRRQLGYDGSNEPDA